MRRSGESAQRLAYIVCGTSAVHEYFAYRLLLSPTNEYKIFTNVPTTLHHRYPIKVKVKQLLFRLRKGGEPGPQPRSRATVILPHHLKLHPLLPGGTLPPPSKTHVGGRSPIHRFQPANQKSTYSHCPIDVYEKVMPLT